MNNHPDALTVTLLLAALSVLPLLLITTTAFLKTVIVLMITRNAIGVQQVPPSMAVYAIALMLTGYVMAPTLHAMVAPANELLQGKTGAAWTETAARTVEPLRSFMVARTKDVDRDAFLEKARAMWPREQAAAATRDDFFIVAPAFMIAEIQAGFEMGFLVYIPFLVIDLIVSNILLALGMQMMSPTTVSLPLKIFLFVVVEGWGKLLHAILDTYL